VIQLKFWKKIKLLLPESRSTGYNMALTAYV